jgi:hypothetical protein
VSVFYAEPGATMMTGIHDFFDAIKAGIPNTVSVSFPSSGDKLDDDTGHLVGTWAGPSPATVAGTGPGSYPGGTGIAINWLTAEIVPISPSSKTVHRIRGRTYIVPLQNSVWDSNGLLTTTYLNTVKTACAALIAYGGGKFVIWHRPSPGGTDGKRGVVTDFKVNQKADFLSSRRD